MQLTWLLHDRLFVSWASLEFSLVNLSLFSTSYPGIILHHELQSAAIHILVCWWHLEIGLKLTVWLQTSKLSVCQMKNVAAFYCLYTIIWFFFFLLLMHPGRRILTTLESHRAFWCVCTWIISMYFPDWNISVLRAKLHVPETQMNKILLWFCGFLLYFDICMPSTRHAWSWNGIYRVSLTSRHPTSSLMARRTSGASWSWPVGIRLRPSLTQRSL